MVQRRSGTVNIHIFDWKYPQFYSKDAFTAFKAVYFTQKQTKDEILPKQSTIPDLRYSHKNNKFALLSTMKHGITVFCYLRKKRRGFYLLKA